MTQPQRDNAPDVRQLGQQSLPESAFPGGKNQSFRVFFEAKVHDAVHRHSREDTSVEICGVLVGRWARDADGPFVHVSESIRGAAAASKFAEVTFTHETWATINSEMDTRFAQLAIVGWYHSHPDFGVFLSDRDRFIQEHFFAGPGQLAYVVDPVRRTEGVFAWHEGRPTLCPHYWVGDRVQVATAAGDEKAVKRLAAMPAETTAAPAAAGSSWTSLALLGSLFLLMFLAGYLLAERLTDYERKRIEQNTLARAWLFLKLHPGLSGALDQADRELRAAAEDTAALAKQHLKLLEEPKETQERWQKILTRLSATDQRLRDIRDQYGTSEDERRLMEALDAAMRAKQETKPADKADAKPAESTGKDKPPSAGGHR